MRVSRVRLSIILAVVVGIAYPYVEIAWKCRGTGSTSEACVWARSYLAVGRWLEPLIVAPIVFVVILLATGSFREPGPSDYIWIDDDGSARRLTTEETKYLAMVFDPSDSGRPYIKASYRTRTPDGKLRGFLDRRKLPGRIPVRGSLRA
jgi:hypothetical protein